MLGVFFFFWLFLKMNLYKVFFPLPRKYNYYLMKRENWTLLALLSSLFLSLHVWWDHQDQAGTHQNPKKARGSGFKRRGERWLDRWETDEWRAGNYGAGGGRDQDRENEQMRQTRENDLRKINTASLTRAHRSAHSEVAALPNHRPTKLWKNTQ